MILSAISNAARKVLPLKYCTAVIVAAGSASRMGGIDKVMAEVGGEAMIRRTARVFQQCDAIQEIVIVTRQDLLVPVMDLCHEFEKVKVVLAGGDTRQASVRIGLGAVSKKTKLVAIQDGARPLVTEQVIDRVVRAAHSYSAAVPAIQVKDTVKTVAGGLVTATPDRSSLRAVQTPQVFDLDLLKAAFVKAEKEGLDLTDDCSAVEKMGFSVRVVEGDERNLKVTTPMDLKIAEMLLGESL